LSFECRETDEREKKGGNLTLLQKKTIEPIGGRSDT